METYAEEVLAGFGSALLPGETEDGSLWIEKQKKFKGLERRSADGSLTLRGWNS